jgi:hypothetical protein
MNCRVCKRETVANPEAATIASGVCSSCRTKLGVVAMPPARRRPVPCSKCACMRFIRAIPREHDNTPAPMVLTHPVATTRMFVSLDLEAVEPSHRLGIGLLETWVCSQCGFMEWYCNDPASLPIGPEYMTEIVDYTSDTPYR